MLRTKLLLCILAGALLLTACSDSSTTPGNEEEEGETIEPTATINNPSGGGEPLEGEVTFAVDGKAENGFAEIRVLVDGEQVASAENPSLPYETSIKTQNYNNGDYNLVAELDVSEPDTTVSDTASVTLENYMLTLETDGYIEYLKEYNKASYMFISDPEGNVLREVELTSKNDGVLEFLPPSMLEDGAPETFHLTLADQTTDYNDRDAFYLSTTIGFKPWSRVYMSYSSSSSDVTKREMELYMHNFNQTPLYTLLSTPNYSDISSFGHYDSPLDTTIKVTEGHDDLVISHTPDYRNVENPTPLYKWENNLTEMPDSVGYDVVNDFNKMVDHSLSVPSDVNLWSYTYYMTVAPNSFEEGDLYFEGFNARNSYADANSSNSGMDMWVPEISDRSFITYLYGVDNSDENIRYMMQTPVGDFPDKFTALDAETQLTNKSMDDLQINISGNADYVRINASNLGETYNHSWSLTVPDTTKSVVFPKIADSLDQSVNNYDRSGFSFAQVFMSDVGKLDGYAGYLDWRYGDSEMTIIEWYDKFRLLNTSGSKLKRAPVVAPSANQNYQSHRAQRFFRKHKPKFEK